MNSKEAVPLDNPSPHGAPLEDLTQQIKQATDVVALIGEYLRVEPAGGRRFRALCPFHDDHKPSLSIDSERQTYKCWACGEGGDVYSFLMKIENLSFYEAKVRLAERAGIVLQSAKNSTSTISRQSYLNVLQWAAEQYQEALFHPGLGRAARDYLLGRQFHDTTLQQFGVGYAPDEWQWLGRRGQQARIPFQLLRDVDLIREDDQGRWRDTFRGRVLFPIRDERGKVLGFGGRILPALQRDGIPKYLNPTNTPVYNKSDVLFGLDVSIAELHQRRQQPGAKAPRLIVVMEGYTDCLMAYQHHYRTAVAPCGTAMTRQQIRKLRRYADRVLMLFDGDTAGQKAAERLTVLFLSEQVDLGICILPDNLDPCDYIQQFGIQPLQELLQCAPDALDYQLSSLQQQFATTTLEGQREAVERILRTLAEVPVFNRAEQMIKLDLAIQRVARWLSLEERELRQRLDQLRQSQSRQTQPHQTQVVAPSYPAHRSMPGQTNPEHQAFPPSQAETASAVGMPTKPHAGQRLDSAPTLPATPTASGGMENWTINNSRQRQVVQYLLRAPQRAGQLRPLLPLPDLTDIPLRQLVAACYTVFDQFQAETTLDHIRELLADPAWDRFIFRLLEEVPTQDDLFERGWQDILHWLTEQQRRAVRQHLFNVAQNHDQDDREQLELLQQFEAYRRRLQDGSP